MPGKRATAAAKKRFGARMPVYEALKGKMGKTAAAKIANAGRTKAGRSRMAKKASRSR